MYMLLSIPNIIIGNNYSLKNHVFPFSTTKNSLLCVKHVEYFKMSDMQTLSSSCLGETEKEEMYRAKKRPINKGKITKGKM